MTTPLLITACLSSPLAGDPPQLDSLFEWALSPFEERFREQQQAGVPHHRIDRALPAPEQGVIRIPIERCWLGKHLVALCSNPILPVPRADAVDHICKRIAVEHTSLLYKPERKIISTTNAWTKSYRLPLRVRLVDRVCWFASGTGRNVRKALRDVNAVGKKVADGYGRVREWIIEEAKEDFSWFAPIDGGTVLMRTLPLLLDGREWLQKTLAGWKRSFGAPCPPYWHQERFTEIAIPC
jgi:hypothetical protein